MAGSAAIGPLQARSADAPDLKGLSPRFGALVAFSNVSMRIAAGQRCAILHSDGAGKAIAFNAIAGDYPRTGGRIRRFGKDGPDLRPHKGTPAEIEDDPDVRRVDPSGGRHG